MTSNDIKYFKDIPTLLRGLKTVTPLMSDFHIHRHEDTPSSHLRETAIFRSDTYSILYLEEGEAKYKIGLSEYHMKPGSFFFHSAYHLRYYQKLSDWKGYVVLFTQPFMNKKGVVDIPKEFPFYQVDADVLLYPDEKGVSRVRSLLDQLHDFYYENEVNKEEILFHYLNILLTYAKGMYTAQNVLEKQVRQSKPVRLAKSFETLLEEHFYKVANSNTNKIFSVKDFADMLSVTPNHLSEVVKNHFGKTPTHLIKERLLMEAKALLRSTELTVSQAALFLHFHDSSHFAKFFKLYTGLSPKEYKLGN